MPMNRDGQNRMDGFLHAAADMDSAQPDVQLYRERYRGSFSGPTLSGSSFDGAGLFVLLGAAAALWLVFAAIHIVTEYWPIVLAVGIALVLLAVSFIVNRWLPGYRRATLMLVTMLVISVTLWITGLTIHNVHFARVRWPSAEAYLRTAFPMDGTSFPTAVGIYVVTIYLLALVPWTRRHSSPGKAILMSNAILLAPIAAAFLIAMLMVGLHKLM
jgi:hypothetical protein